MSYCIFSDIAVGEERAHRVYEDERTLAFLNEAPANRGHVLVIPNSHCETRTDMDETLGGSMFQTVRRVASAANLRMRHPA